MESGKLSHKSPANAANTQAMQAKTKGRNGFARPNISSILAKQAAEHVLAKSDQSKDTPQKKNDSQPRPIPRRPALNETAGSPKEEELNITHTIPGKPAFTATTSQSPKEAELNQTRPVPSRPAPESLKPEPKAELEDSTNLPSTPKISDVESESTQSLPKGQGNGLSFNDFAQNAANPEGADATQAQPDPCQDSLQGEITEFRSITSANLMLPIATSMLLQDSDDEHQAHQEVSNQAIEPAERVIPPRPSRFANSTPHMQTMQRDPDTNLASITPDDDPSKGENDSWISLNNDQVEFGMPYDATTHGDDVPEDRTEFTVLNRAAPDLEDPVNIGKVALPRIIFIDGAHTPRRFPVDKALSLEYPFAGQDADLQIRVRHIDHNNSNKSDLIRLEVQALRDFKPWRFLRRVAYLYSFFEVFVVCIVFTLSFVHHIIGGWAHGNGGDILRFFLLFHFLHVMSHVMCSIIRAFVDIFSNFQYIQYVLAERIPACFRRLFKLKRGLQPFDDGYHMSMTVLSSEISRIVDDVYTTLFIVSPIIAFVISVLFSPFDIAIRNSQLCTILMAAVVVLIYILDHLISVGDFIHDSRTSNDNAAKVVRTNNNRDLSQNDLQSPPLSKASQQKCFGICSMVKSCGSAVSSLFEKRMQFLLSSIVTRREKRRRASSCSSENNQKEVMCNCCYQYPSPDGPVYLPSLLETTGGRMFHVSKGMKMELKEKLSCYSRCQGYFHLGVRVFVVICCVGIVIAILIKGKARFGATLVGVLTAGYATYKWCSPWFAAKDGCLFKQGHFCEFLFGVVLPASTNKILLETFDKEYRWQRVWLAKPKQRLWVFLLVFGLVASTLCTVFSILLEDAGTKHMWAVFSSIVLVLSLVFFLVDPQPWLSLSDRDMFSKAGIQRDQNLTPKQKHCVSMLTWSRRQRVALTLLFFLSILYLAGVNYIYQFDEQQGAEGEIDVYPREGIASYGVEPSPMGYCKVNVLWNASNPVELSLQDFAFFAAMAYESSKRDLQYLTERWFENSVASVEIIPKENIPDVCKSPGIETKFFTASQDNYTQVILSIRGTTAWRDFLEDITVWGPVVIMEIASKILPFGDFWRSSIPFLLRATSLFSESEYADKLSGCLDFLQMANNITLSGDSLILTGHSLGGGIAAILGARKDVHNVIFSAPGVEQTLNMDEANDEREALRRNTINVVPDGDPFPTVDLPAYHTQRIECNDQTSLRLLRCHSILRTTNELSSLCNGEQYLGAEENPY